MALPDGDERPEDRAERLKAALVSFEQDKSRLDRRLSDIEAHLPNSPPARPIPLRDHSHSRAQPAAATPALQSASMAIPTITPKPRPILPTRTRYGYPLRDPSPDSDLSVPKAVAPVGLQPSPADIIAWPQRGPAAHRVSFLLNPVMNPAKDHIRDLSPPPRRPGPAPNLLHSPSLPPDCPSLPGGDSHLGQPRCSPNTPPSPILSSGGLVPLPTTHVTVSLPGTAMVPLSMVSSGNPGCPDARPAGKAGSHASTLSDAEVERYWELFFSRYSNRLTWSPTEVSSVDSVRATSDLLFSSIISVSAKVLCQDAFCESCVEDSKTMTRSTIFPLRHHNIQDLKGIMILAIYHGYHSVCSHFVTLCLTLSLHKVFVKLTDPILRGATMEEELVEKGRTWLLVVIYSHVLSIFSKKMYLICSPPKVIKDHTSILRMSKFKKECDPLIQAHIELVIVLSLAQTKLDSRNYPGPLADRKQKHVLPELPGVVEELEAWTRDRTSEAPELVGWSAGGPRQALRKPRQYVMLYILHTVLWPCRDGREIVRDEAMLERAREGCRLAAGILGAALELGSESDEASVGGQESLPLEIEYHKATLGLATGYLLWMSLLVPGHVPVHEHRALFGRLHAIEFRHSCEHTDLIEKAIMALDEVLVLMEREREGVQRQQRTKKKKIITSSGLGSGRGPETSSFSVDDSTYQSSPVVIGRDRKGDFVGEISVDLGIVTITEIVADDIERLITDTRFWFQVAVG